MQDIAAQALEFAREAHKGVVRKDGSEYITHPIRVGAIVQEWVTDEEVLAAAYLHDVVEDTHWSGEDIVARFGSRVATLVDGVTKIGRITPGKDTLAETYRKMILRMSDDFGVILIKLADRLDNMRTIQHLPEHKQARIAQETMDIYAPIAHRLGMYIVYRELEDRAFAVLEPVNYRRVSELLAADRDALDHRLETLRTELEGILKEYEVDAIVSGRVKGIYSCWKKMQTLGTEDLPPYDVIGLRVVTKRIKDCYQALGLIHTHWTPLPGGFRDYIANPKANGYMSLHTRVRAHSQPLEVQVRTAEMHADAQYGIAAHYNYKQGEIEAGRRADFVQGIDTERDQFIAHLKAHLFQEEIHALTPAGKVVILPMGSTALDFAYSLHTDIGDHAIGVRIDGVYAPLGRPLRTGETVRIITDEKAHPHANWPELVRTERARENIWRYLRAQDRLAYMQRGRECLIKHAHKVGLTELLESWALPYAANDLGYSQADALYEALGRGKLRPSTVIRRMVAASAQHYQGTPYSLQIQGRDTEGILASVGSEIARWGGNVLGHEGSSASGFFTLHMHVSGQGDPDKLLARLRSVQGVFEATYSLDSRSR
jgi:GTP pyrophosphokinase